VIFQKSADLKRKVFRVLVLQTLESKGTVPLIRNFGTTSMERLASRPGRFTSEKNDPSTYEIRGVWGPQPVRVKSLLLEIGTYFFLSNP
jgi:hypothetical protein